MSRRHAVLHMMWLICGAAACGEARGMGGAPGTGGAVGTHQTSATTPSGTSATTGTLSMTVGSTSSGSSQCRPTLDESALEQVKLCSPQISNRRLNYPDGVALTQAYWRQINDCTVCQRNSLVNVVCGRSRTCNRPVCVMTDGTELAIGQVVETEWCVQCTCQGDGSVACSRSNIAGCPALGCKGTVWSTEFELAADEGVFISECDGVFCAETGPTPRYSCGDGCDVPDGRRVPDGFADLDVDGATPCVCAYGSYCCATPGQFFPELCPLPGAACALPGGGVLRSGAYVEQAAPCLCVDGALLGSDCPT